MNQVSDSSGLLQSVSDKLFANNSIDSIQKDYLNASIVSLSLLVRMLSTPSAHASPEVRQKLNHLVHKMDQLVSNLDLNYQSSETSSESQDTPKPVDENDSEFEDEMDLAYAPMDTPTKQTGVQHINFNREINFTALNTPGLNRRPSLKERYTSSGSVSSFNHDVFLD